MTISWSRMTSEGPRKIYVSDVVRVEPGKSGVSYWRYDGKKELMYYVSYESGNYNVCISQ